MPAAPRSTSQPQHQPTSSEVARRAGVSRTTVSFVLNGVTNQGISEATRERVLAAARELGYEPHAAARSLAGGATGTVALVIPKVEHLYFDAFLEQLVASINDHCHRHGLKLLVEATEQAGGKASDLVKLVRSRRIDGMIVAHLRTAEMAPLRQMHEAGIPLVVFGCDLLETDRFHTMGDNTSVSARMAVNHLIGLGHRRIGLVNHAQPEFHSVNQREHGWRQALAEHGITAEPAWVTYADVSAESGYRATRELLARGLELTALFAGNDTIAFGALRALHEAGLRVPQDIAVVGYDDIPFAPFASPPLTTVHSDPIGHGRQAVQMLLAQLEGGDPAAVAPVPAPTLVIRESCGARLAGQAAAPAVPKRAASRSRSLSADGGPAPARRSTRSNGGR